MTFPDSQKPAEGSPSLNRWWAIIPAAGLSRRMGAPKLLLPYRGTTILGKLFEGLRTAGVESVAVVTRPDDLALQSEVLRLGGELLIPSADPPDMRDSVEFGLSELEARHHPHPREGWILIPADHPLLSPETLLKLISEWNRISPEVLVPTWRGKRGHPALLRWDLRRLIPQIPPEWGLNWILRRSGIHVAELELDDPLILEDLDTPEDYERLCRNDGGASTSGQSF